MIVELDSLKTNVSGTAEEPVLEADLDLIVHGTKFDTNLQVLGVMLIIFSFFIIFDWESCYVDDVVYDKKKSEIVCGKVSNIYLGSEDGAVYYLMVKLTNGNIALSRILTFVVVPFILTFLGILLIQRKLTIEDLRI